MSEIRFIEDLLSADSTSAVLRSAARDYYNFLSELSGVSEESLHIADDDETILSSGKAISPKNAARCVLDHRRTSHFLRGIFDAINEAKRRFPGEKIEILYAGCGPFATLAVPFCYKFTPDEIAFTMIDIHQRSLDGAADVFQKLGFENFISDYLKTDATVFRAENDKKFHIVITETMQKTLEKEPQVEVTLNIVKMLRENGILIPQKISIEANLANLKKEFSFDDENKKVERERFDLGNIFELTKETATESESLLKPQIIELPETISKLNTLILLTKITIFESNKLDDYDSGLTYPTIVCSSMESRSARKIEFRYIPGDKPHFEHRFI